MQRFSPAEYHQFATNVVVFFDSFGVIVACRFSIPLRRSVEPSIETSQPTGNSISGPVRFPQSAE